MKITVVNRFRIVLILILGIAILLRWFSFQKRIAFADYDEYYTLKTAIGIYESKIPNQAVVDLEFMEPTSFIDASRDAMRDFGNSFSYNLLLHFTGKIFGQSDEVFRWFSLVFDLLSILLLVSIGRSLQISDNRILFACLAFALFPVFISYAATVRTYAFSTTITLLLMRSVIRANRYRNAGWPMLFIVVWSLLLFFSHYLSAYIIGVIAGVMWLFKRYYSEHYKRVVPALMIAGVLCLGYAYYNYSNLNNIYHRDFAMNNQSKNKDIEDRRNVEMSADKLTFHMGRYLNNYYIGSDIIAKVAEIVIGKTFSLFALIVSLAIPIILLLNLSPHHPQQQWLYLFGTLFLVGNLWAVALMAASGHFIYLGVKYTILTIPFYLMAVFFFIQRSKWSTVGLCGLFAALLLFNYFALKYDYKKEIHVAISGSVEHPTYNASNVTQLQTDIMTLLETHTSDTLFVNTTEDLVFLKCFFPQMNYHYAYVLKNDPKEQYQHRVLPIHFSTPN